MCRMRRVRRLIASWNGRLAVTVAVHAPRPDRLRVRGR
ncbi:hypothetical protein I553_9318 [Mycobacterium xenopi 4042]|uniref:Uncharacterized protein n=1 Tax=Mycobacterium xenopi 4042 TaxID=1299334 RepID=X8DWZ7_MYCXE|nr:hypothetical protein I552_1353 [Mycobacterium xenopi 3993]EUA73162.1 hypothetical protein I553_9318 [Mycobacterium xenopi 4042]